MSKAFTRESDDQPEQLPPPRVSAVPGGKNYITPGGAQRMQAELDRLTQARNSSNPPVEEIAKREQQLLTQQIFQLQQTLSSLVIVPPPAQPWDQVLFGATVTVRDQAGDESRYRIVGVDETDLDRDWISWLSPVARALLKAKLGQKIQLRLPTRTQELEIVGITYE